MKTINQNTPVRCNKCQSKFEAPKEMKRTAFNGQSAARIMDDFCTCPICGQTDCHWVYAKDIMPIFEGSKGQIKRQENEWLENN